MKKLVLLSAAVLFSFGMNVFAQTAVPAQGSTDGSAVQTEIRTMSAQLKESYGAVYQQLNLLNKEVDATGTAPTAEQAASREEMTMTLAQLEGMLSTVNTADEQQWNEIKAKAEMVTTRATALLDKRKAGK